MPETVTFPRTGSEYTWDYNELLYLRARYYSPRIGRFITKDTWAGDANLPLSYNKWSYANANPIMYRDPSGKCVPYCLVAGVATVTAVYDIGIQLHQNGGNWGCIDWGEVAFSGGAGGVSTLMIISRHPMLMAGGFLTLGGYIYYGPPGSEWRGLRFVQRAENKSAINAVAYDNVPSILIATGISVQYNWNGFPLETLIINPIQQITGSPSSIGPAQVHSDEVSGDPNNINVAAVAMADRINDVISYCNNHTCSERDKLVASLMAQNGSGFNRSNLIDADKLLHKPSGDIDWATYFTTRKQDNAYTQMLYHLAGGKDWSTRHQLSLAVHDLRTLFNEGWSLPNGISQADLAYIDCLANNSYPEMCQ